MVSCTYYSFDLDKLKKEYLSNMSTTELSKEYGCSVWTIISNLKKAGISSFRRGNSGKYRNYSISGWKLSDEAKNKIRNSQLGERNNNWKGGVSTNDQLTRNSLEYKEWRKNVFERDDYTCQECKCRGKRLEAHHIESFAEYPEKRLDINNGVSLCHKCHMKTKTKENLFIERYKKMINKNRGVQNG